MAISKSDRALITTTCMEALAPKSWAVIDATLQSFGLPTTEFWQGERDGYIANALKDADDDTLSEFGAYHGCIPAVANQPQVPGVQAGEYEVFISHLSSEQAFAGKLQDALAKFDVKSFVAHKDVEPAKEWQNEIEGCLKRCDALVALLHPGFHKSYWTDQEIGFVMGRNKPAFAVKFGEPPYGFIGKFQAFNGNDKSPEAIAYEVFKTLVKVDSTPVLARACLKVFCQSNNFANASRHVELIEVVKFWDEPMANELESALKANKQIAGATFQHVPERTEAVIKKWRTTKPG